MSENVNSYQWQREARARAPAVLRRMKWAKINRVKSKIKLLKSPEHNFDIDIFINPKESIDYDNVDLQCMVSSLCDHPWFNSEIWSNNSDVNVCFNGSANDVWFKFSSPVYKAIDECVRLNSAAIWFCPGRQNILVPPLTVIPGRFVHAHYQPNGLRVLSV